MKTQPPLMSDSEADNAWHLGNDRLFGTKPTTTLAIEQEIATLQSQLARQRDIDNMQSSSAPGAQLTSNALLLNAEDNDTTRRQAFYNAAERFSSVPGAIKMNTKAFLLPKQPSEAMRENNCAITPLRNLPAQPTRRPKVNHRLDRNHHALKRLLMRLRSTSPTSKPEQQTTSWLTQEYLMSYYVNNIWISSPIFKCRVPDNYRLQSCALPTNQN